MSVPLADTVTVPATTASAAGAVIDTAGGSRSFDTVTLTGAEVLTLPAASRATAFRVCAPFGSVVVSQVRA